MIQLKNDDDLRRQFPVTQNYAYFQHPAVGALPARTRTAVRELVDDMTQNGCLNNKEWLEELGETRRWAAKLLGTTPGRIGFVSSTSHGLSWLAESLPLETEDSVLVPDCEFPANQFPWQHLERRGIQFRTLETEEGTFTVDDVDEALLPSTKVLSLSSVQFHNGFRADLEAIGQLCRQRNVFFVVDAIQSLGWDSIDVESLPVDAVVADGHKWLCAPEGAGILYLDETFQERLDPALVGWHSVEDRYEFEEPVFDLRSDAAVIEMGSQNTIGLIGLGTSLSVLLDVGLERIRQNIVELRGYLTEELGDRGFDFAHGSWAEENKSSIIALNHPELPADGLVECLEDRGVQLTRRGDRLRVGLHFYNNRDDVDRLLELLESAVAGDLSE